MKTEYTFYKNSNTGELIMKQHFYDTQIQNIPDYFYDINKKKILNPDLTGFVIISEKKFNREYKRNKKSNIDNNKI